jgi:hypothetical protein
MGPAAMYLFNLDLVTLVEILLCKLATAYLVQLVTCPLRLVYLRLATAATCK